MFSLHLCLDHLKKFFEEEFGPVEDALVIGTKVGHRVISKGYGFLTFKQEDTMKMAVKTHFATISGKIIKIRSALPRCQMETSSTLSDQELFKDDLDEANDTNDGMPYCGDSNGELAKIAEVPPWLVKFKKWFPAYLNKTCKRLGEGEWYPLSSLKGDFRATCGMELDHESIGFLKLSDFLRSLPGICKMQVISTGNGSPTHMVLRPFYSFPCNQSQQSMSEFSDATSLSDESILHETFCVENASFMQRSPNPGRWEPNLWLATDPGRIDDGFQEYNLWKSTALFDSLEETTALDSTQQNFSFFARQWDSGLVCSISFSLLILFIHMHTQNYELVRLDCWEIKR